jgi:hypothetical protein
MQNSQKTGVTQSPAMPWSPAFWFHYPPAESAPGSGAPATRASTPVSTIENMMRSFAQGSNPWLKAYAQTGSEVVSLMTRRSQALMALPAQVGQCRAPQDILSMQARYWQATYQQNVDAMQRISAVWGSVLPIAGALARSAGEAATVSPPRDRLMLTEPKDLPATPTHDDAASPATVSEPRQKDKHRTAA